MTDPDGVGEGECDGQRQALGHGDNEHSDTNDEESYEVSEVFHAPLTTLDDESLQRETDNQDYDGQNGHDRP